MLGEVAASTGGAAAGVVTCVAPSEVPLAAGSIVAAGLTVAAGSVFGAAAGGGVTGVCSTEAPPCAGVVVVVSAVAEPGYASGCRPIEVAPVAFEGSGSNASARASGGSSTMAVPAHMHAAVRRHL